MNAPANDTPNYTPAVDAAKSISSNATAGMQTFSAAQTARAARLTAVQTRLQLSSTTPPSTLQKLSASIAASSALAQNTATLAVRISARPSVDPTDIAVFGTVTDATGAAAPSLLVRLTDAAGSLVAGASVKTSAAGDFSLVLKSCEIPTTDAEFVVSVENAAGVSAATSAAIKPKAGSPVYVSLTLPSTPDNPAQAPTPRPRPKPTPRPGGKDKG